MGRHAPSTPGKGLLYHVVLWKLPPPPAWSTLASHTDVWVRLSALSALWSICILVNGRWLHGEISSGSKVKSLWALNYLVRPPTSNFKFVLSTWHWVLGCFKHTGQGDLTAQSYIILCREAWKFSRISPAGDIFQHVSPSHVMGIGDVMVMSKKK